MRYFQIIEDVVGDILGILHHPLNKIHSPTNALEVKIGDLLEAFMALTSYDRYIITGELEIEKDKEETLHALDARKPTHEELKKLLEEYYFRRL